MVFQIYRDRSGEYRWRLMSGGRVVADSAEGYSNRNNARRAAESVRVNAGSARVEDVYRRTDQRARSTSDGYFYRGTDQRGRSRFDG